MTLLSNIFISVLCRIFFLFVQVVCLCSDSRTAHSNSGLCLHETVFVFFSTKFWIFSITILFSSSLVDVISVLFPINPFSFQAVFHGLSLQYCLL